MFTRTLSIGLLFALAVSGYPLIAATMSVLDMGDTRLPSIVFRLCVVGLAVAALVLNRHDFRLRSALFTAAFAIFWVAYLGRIINDGFLVGDMSDLYVPIEVLSYALIFALLPSLGGFIGLDRRGSRIAFTCLLVLTSAAAVMTLLDGRELLQALEGREAVRYSLEKLNPISIGNVGGILLLLCLHGLFARGSAALGIVSRGLYAFGMAVGMFLLLVAASRGPAVAAVVALLIYWVLPPRVNRLIVGAVIAAILLLGISQIYGYVKRQFDVDVSTRFVQAAEGESASVDAREGLFGGAYQQFVDHPLFGDALFEEASGGYTHNAMLEALLATGIVGGTAYLLCLLLGSWAAVRLVYRAEGHEWLGLLTIFALVGAQFSGAHFTLNVHWFTLVGAVATDALARDSLHAGSRNRRRRRSSRSRRSGGIALTDAL